MSYSFWARPLTNEEEIYTRNKSRKKIEFFLEPMAIMGPSTHLYIRCLNVELKTYRVHLGEGQYIDETMGGGPATGGHKIPVTWGIDPATNYVLKAAQKLGIPFIHHPYVSELTYFPKAYVDAFSEAFRHADRALGAWHKNQSFIGKWFGPTYPENESKESISIEDEVRKILKNQKL